MTPTPGGGPDPFDEPTPQEAQDHDLAQIGI